MLVRVVSVHPRLNTLLIAGLSSSNSKKTNSLKSFFGAVFVLSHINNNFLAERFFLSNFMRKEN